MKYILIVASILMLYNCTTKKQEAIFYESRKTSLVANREGDTYKINLDAEECTIDISDKLGKESVYKEQIDKEKGVRKISINGIASHAVGIFPNRGNPNHIQEHKMSVQIPLYPKLAATKTRGQGYDTGILFSGVSLEPFTAEFFIGKNGQINRKWNITTLTTTEDLGLDCNNAHVQPTGRYHYHGTPSAYLADLEDDGSKMIKLGYASDGFPIYYKYGYDENGQLVSHESGYRLKAGQRPGDGITAPDGYYNGRYFNDYEYVKGYSPLDECNGRWGKTPESDNEYYYIITDNFPSVPICFSGTPSEEMRKHRGGRDHGPRRGRRPPPPRRGFRS
jgi:hypothetical protein